MNIHKLKTGEAPYTCLPNDGINVLVRRDPIAFAIWGYLLSKPADWVIHPAEVMQTLGIGKTKYRLAMLALKEEGYALRTPIIGDGHLSGSRLALCAVPNALHDEVVNESQTVDSIDHRSVDSLTVGARDSLIPRQSHSETVSSRDSLGNGPLTKERSSTKKRKNTKEREIYIGESPDFDSGSPPSGKSPQRQNPQPEGQSSLLPDADSGKPKTKPKPKAKPKAKNSPIQYTEEFAVFWKEYPRGDGKSAALTAWEKIDASERPAIMANLALKPFAYRADNFIPQGSKYLNQRMWEDEVITTNQKTGSMYL